MYQLYTGPNKIIRVAQLHVGKKSTDQSIQLLHQLKLHYEVIATTQDYEEKYN